MVSCLEFAFEFGNSQGIACYIACHTHGTTDIKQGTTELKQDIKQGMTELKQDIQDLATKLDKSLEETIAVRATAQRVITEVDNLERRSIS